MNCGKFQAKYKLLEKVYLKSVLKMGILYKNVIINIESLRPHKSSSKRRAFFMR